jgi:hypothetical protein
MNNSGNYTNKESIKTILLEHGYPVKDGNGYINTAALYRGGSDPTSVAIYEDRVVDFVTSAKYKIEEFLKLVTNQSSDVELEKYLQKNNIVLNIPQEPKIKMPVIFPDELVHHFYF